ncbi:hypothetical protein BGZ93_005567 [Podila epicladia]|nr:hypothetical protein BGZ93_005567 [Podila epicladia]
MAFRVSTEEEFMNELPLWALRWINVGVAIVDLSYRRIYNRLGRLKVEEELLDISDVEKVEEMHQKAWLYQQGFLQFSQEHGQFLLDHFKHSASAAVQQLKGSGNDKASGGSSFRSSLSGALGDGKKSLSNQRAPLPPKFPEPIREEPQNTGPVRRRRNVGYQPFNKDKFINANFRFLMNPGSNYEVFTMDPDVRVCWEDIEQVLIAVPQSCPICLQPPVAGRITKCGHVYCFHCILHYLALSESNKSWRKCPICWDAIYEKDLKSVRTVHADLDAFDQGEKEIAKQIASHQEVHLEMRLIQRSMNSTLALPRSKTFPLPENLLPLELRGQPPLEFYPDAMVFSRLMISTPGRIVAELERDIQSIEFSVEEAKSYDANMQPEEIVFFEMALDKIREKKIKIQDDARFFPRDALSRERILRHFIEHGTEESSAKATAQSNEAKPSTFYLIATGSNHAEHEKSIGSNVVTSATREVPISTTDVRQVDPRREHTAQDEGNVIHFESKSAGHRQAKTPNHVTSVYYFYQAANGHHLYLQPLDIRILKQHFETYERFPDTITVKVLGIEETSLTEEVRKKCKYLGHLPLGCEVSFLDVALEGIVGDEGIKAFEPELRLRRTKRREKEAREERERLEREHKLNPSKARRDDFFANDPFFHVDAGANGMAFSGRKNSEADLREAIRLSQAALEETMPTLSEANARTTGRRPSLPMSSGSGSGAKSIPRGLGSGLSSTALELDPWASSSYESNASSATLAGSNLSATSLALGTSTSSTNTGSTVWGTPSVPVNRHHDDYDDYYDDEHDYETEVYVKRGKKKVAVLMTNNSRRAK